MYFGVFPVFRVDVNLAKIVNLEIIVILVTGVLLVNVAHSAKIVYF